MSALAGALHFDTTPVDRALLERLTTFTPGNIGDALGFWQAGNVGLGHAMFRVTCEACHETQPLSDPLSGCVVVFDGRIDNRAELLSQLAGYARLTDQQFDAAYALAGYLKWGTDVSSYLLGDFAFAIWDPQTQQLFLTRAGWGKSTTVAAFYDHGYPMVCDDILAVKANEEGLQVFPSFPRLKVWPAVATYLKIKEEGLSPLQPATEKLGRSVLEKFSPSPLPLHRMYVLSEGASVAIQALPPQEALIELVRNTFAVRFLYPKGSPAHFARCSQIVASVPVCRLSRPHSLATIPLLVTAVEKDIAAE